MKKLQVKINGVWSYVFCRSGSGRIILTGDRRKALGQEALDYFARHYANHEFKLG